MQMGEEKRGRGSGGAGVLVRFRGTWMVFNGEVTQSNGQFPTEMGRYGPEMNAQWCICVCMYVCIRIDNRYRSI